MSKDSIVLKTVRIIQKLFVSGLVICAFIAYAIQERLANPDSAIPPSAPASNASTTDQVLGSVSISPTAPPASFASPTIPVRSSANASVRPSPTAQPLPTAATKSSGAYRDGSYTGGTVNAYWGMVQVKATIQNGKIAAVQFLQYPSDRRTSQRINLQVMPYLQTEAIKAQNANVDVISGATLTSQAFIRSLQSALNTAKN